MPNFLLIQEINNCNIKQKIKVRYMANFPKENFQATLENEEITDFSDTQDIDNMYNTFQTKLLKATDKHALFKTLSQKEVKMRKKSMDNKTNTNKNKGKEQNL